MNRTDRRTIRRLTLPILLLAVLLFAACNQADPTPPSPAEEVEEAAEVEEVAAEAASEVANMLDLAGTAWALDSVGEPDADLNALEGVRSTLNFSVDGYLGSGGCNWYLGVYSIDTPKLFLRPPFMTQQICDEPLGAMDQEGLYFGALFSTTDYAMEDDKLVLYLDGPEGQRLVTLSPAEHAQFEGTNWGLKALFDGEKWFEAVVEPEVTAQFVDGVLAGNSGCNDYTATYAIEGRDLTIEDLASTDETCDVVPEALNQETVYLELLEQVAGHEVLGGMLTLVNADGEAIMFFGVQ